ncbi:MAG: pyridoxal phosphate-dependent aminotransferase [Phycisphaerales bacterium]
MRLSRRVQNLKPSATLAVSAKAAALRGQGIDVVSFGAGEPDFDTPDHIKDAAIDAIRDGWTKYVASAGDPAARKSIAHKLREENGLKVDAEHVVITPGAKQAIFLALLALLEPEEKHEAVVPTPAWVSYRPMCELCGGTVVEVPTTLDDGFKMSPEQLRKALTPRSRVLILNSPSNPCGTVYTPSEIEALAAVVTEHNRTHDGALVVISDEIYEKLIYGETEFVSVGRFLDSEQVVTVNGLSKTYAMTGWRIGYAATVPTLARAMAKLQSQMNTSITACCYPAIPEALDHGAEDIERMRRVFAMRAELMREGLEAIPGLRTTRPEGAFYLFPDVSAHFGKRTPKGHAIEGALGFAETLLEEQAVAVVPGDDFGGCGRSHVRLSFATAEERIKEGLDRLAKFVDSLER